MSSTANILVTLYSPVVLAIIALLMIARIKMRHNTVITLQPFGIFGVSLPISSPLIARILLAVAACGFLGLYAFLDFSILFPKHLQMEIFFDERGLARMLQENFRPADLERLGIAKNYAGYRPTYFDNLDTEVRKILGGDHFFSVQDGAVHSSGETSFVVAKLNGWQRYHIQESKGELLHTLDIPHRPTLQFYTLFEKLPSADDYVTPSFADLVIQRRVILHPKFKQLLAENRTSKTVTFNVALVGMTSVTLFPWPGFSPTIYCADLSSGLVPFAYAIYK